MMHLMFSSNQVITVVGVNFSEKDSSIFGGAIKQ